MIEQPWYKSNLVKYAIAVIIVIIVIVCAILLYRYFTSGKEDNDDSKKKEDVPKTTLGSESDVSGAEKEDFSSCPGPIELPCREGPEGPAGPAGGIYSDKGPLRNLAQTDMVVDRMDGAGVYANAFLSQRNYKPQQTWTLYSSEGDLANRLSNQYGGCLTVDKIGNVNMTTQGQCKTATKWIFTPQGSIRPMNERSKCLSYTNAGIIKNLPAGEANMKGKGVNPYSNLLKLNVVPCDAKLPLNQQWSFS
jgi:hypothetical protein